MAKVKKIFKNDGTLVIPAGVKSIRAKKIFVHSLLKFWGYDNMADFANGSGFVHFLDFENNMYGWGMNGFFFGTSGYTGTNDTADQSVPKLVSGGRKFRRQAAGISNPAGITLDGDLYSWGANQGGSIGNNTTTTAFSSPVLVSGGLKWREARMPWGITLQGDLYIWGFNNAGCVGGGFNTPTMVSTPTLVLGGRKWRKAMTNGNLSFGQDTDGNCWSWGSNADFFGAINGNLGAGLAITAVSSPVAISGGIKFKEIIPGPGVWGLSEANDLYVWGMGAPFFDANQEGTITASTPFITVSYQSYSTPHLVTAYGKIKKIAPLANVGDPKAGFGSSQARKMLAEDGTLWSWGWDGIFFQASCGNGLPQGSSTPVIIMAAKKFKFISFNTSNRHWVIENNGDMWAWGENGNGALGIGIHDNMFVYRSTPTLVVGGKKWDWIVDNAAGLIAKATDGTLWTWGTTMFSNTAGFPNNISSPVPVRNSLFFKEGEEIEVNEIGVTPGSSYSVIITTGFPRFGDTQLGTNPYADRIEIEYDV